ncbi:MAG: cinnamycin family lantibiotic [Pseudonocardiaceae bacterium]
MPVSTLQPRVVNEIDESAIDMLDDSLFLDADAAHGIVACRKTCVSGFTWKCDGETFTRTCVSGETWKCDG